ncbi:MAG: DNA polymerase III subunit beta [Planctomycetes bacterium]|jgi:DNA polymerase-3 subunit beta|nr:DNA polymerase III subunit beta [Planctomycetota bacterium]
MKVLCNREKLREGLAITNGVIPTRSTKAVLENVCLVATDDTLELVGTDLEVSVRYRIDDVKVDEPGPVVIPSRVALDFVRDLSGETVTLETKDGNCFITSGADSCELVTVDPDEYPVVPRFDSEKQLPLQGGILSRLVNQTSFAAAREPGRYAMHGILLEIEDETLRMVGTDGRRLALSSTPVDAGKGKWDPVIVPAKGMQLFCRVISDPLDTIHLDMGEHQIGMQTQNAEIFARLIDGEFPRYAAVVPTDCGESVEADTEMLNKKLRLVANVTGEDARAVKLKLKKNELELFGQSIGRGEATAHMEVAFKGKAAEIAFNPDYVMDGLKNCEGDTVRLEFKDRTSPGKFTLGENFIYVVMPITVEA